MTERRKLYAVLAFIGAAVPLALSAWFIADHGLDGGELIDQAFAGPAAAAFVADVSISSIVFWVWMWPEARAIGVSPWGFLAANLFIGLSFALPLFLYVRETKGARQLAGSDQAQ